ncbi:DsrE family protein [sulfur-oxidizing endosymbiont of Gigantopelta aegis]|uniref:DsrE family protein n=1 Tax=sulfur-oxidizing endosymbiont of Gigantopelta aegis TaxID=2794934 RepID=UPI001FE2DB96|nr:DsrE family protein [sulfur-oxidizing endosymbiont of Gigantopelta aegis]
MIKKIAQRLLLLLVCYFCSGTMVYASNVLTETAPWGSADVLDIQYKPEKVLYDMISGDKEYLIRVLDRLAYLNKLYGSDTFDASIVVVIHGEAIPFFAIDKTQQHQDMMARAQSLTVGTAIEFRMCRASAKLLHYEPENIHGFVQMVPMADAEIIRLQADGYSYMH